MHVILVLQENIALEILHQMSWLLLSLAQLGLIVKMMFTNQSIVQQEHTQTLGDVKISLNVLSVPLVIIAQNKLGISIQF